MRVVVSVPPEGAGERLDRFVAGLTEVGSRGAAERLLAEGRVLVDGAVQPKSRRLAGGEELALELPDAVAPVAARELPEVGIPYADEHVLVVDKPAGLAVHPGAGRQLGTLVDVLAPHGAAGGDPERPGIVHRLDKETSGLLVVARSQEAYTALARLVRAHGLTRPPPRPPPRVPAARPRPPKVAGWPRRRADRRRPPRPAPPLARHRDAEG